MSQSMTSGVYQRAVPEQSCDGPKLAAAAVRVASDLPKQLRQLAGENGAGLGYLEISRTAEGRVSIGIQHLYSFNPAHQPCVNLRGRTRNLSLVRQLHGAWLPENSGDLLGIAMVSPDTDGDLDWVEIFMSQQQSIQLLVDRSGRITYIESDAAVEGHELYREAPDLYWESDRWDNGLWWLSHHLLVVSGDLDLMGNADFGDDLDNLLGYAPTI